jgi:hypothetical protein
MAARSDDVPTGKGPAAAEAVELAHELETLRASIPGRPFGAHFQARAAIRHTVYHSGQIGLLRKGVSTAPR